MLAQESRLEKKVQFLLVDNAKVELNDNITLNVAQTRNNLGGRGSNGSFANNRGRGQRGFRNRNGRRGGRSFQGFQGFESNQNFSSLQKQQVMCQLCGKGGHIVWNCYHRFDYSFHASQYGNQNANDNSKHRGQISAMIPSPDIVCDLAGI